MKKCKVTLAEGARNKFFYLFPDAEIVQTLVEKSTKKSLAALFKSHPESEMISLKRGQWLEVEWNGCQISYFENKDIRINFLRLIKATNVPRKKSKEGSLVSIHFGWMLNDHLRFLEGNRDDMNVHVLKEYDEQFDFSELFQDNETVEDILKKGGVEDII